MAMELILNFPDPAQVVVELLGAGRPRRTAPLPFQGPLTETDQDDLHWYLEVYPTHYGTELDDTRAAAVADRLADWGTALFDAVFKQSYEAARLYDRFAAETGPGRLFSIDSGHPGVLAQPWELLRHPEGTWLFLANPRISVCRRLSGQGQAAPFAVAPKERLHLLFVVCRPDEAGFIDPRSDPRAVMEALETQAPGRVTVEFLRPPTLSHLIARLEDEDRTPVDILHFDGHGVYDPDGSLAPRAAAGLKGLAGARGWDRGGAGGGGAHQGYLLFENETGGEHLVPAPLLGEMLNEQRIGLTILSACQSAKVGGDDPLGSVAAQLTRAGLPTVLAMTHSVLVDTTRALFGHLYRELGRGRALGTALENARRELHLHPGRGERRRGAGWITLHLQDWFLPALYRTGEDGPLLTKTAEAAGPTIANTEPARHNLPEVQPSGFWGRAPELWEIERAFVCGTRRLVIDGFGGQGKTVLAEESGRWLFATGLFERVCLVRYAGFQGIDPVGYAVGTLGAVLGENLLDEGAATAALARTPTLLILDNLESLAGDPGAGDPGSIGEAPPGGKDARAPLDALLGAALAWSNAGASRLLCTTRTPDLGHPGYPTDGDRRCRYLNLGGLAPADALAWYQALGRERTRPRPPDWQAPDRDDLLALFARVRFHPLSIGLLAETLNETPVAAVTERLDQLLAAGEGPLMASLDLSLERLDPGSRALLPRLGVFEGGAFESDLLEVTEITAEQWARMKPGLIAAGLIQPESIPGPDYPLWLRFHPTLAPTMWARLDQDQQRRPGPGVQAWLPGFLRTLVTPDQRRRLAKRFRMVHYERARYLYHEDDKDVRGIRTMAWLVLPSLLVAVRQALEVRARDADAFAGYVNWFLDIFGLTRDRADLTRRLQALAGGIGSRAWFLARSGQGEALVEAGQYAEAARIFEEVLAGLGGQPSHNRCAILGRLGNCLGYQRQSTKAEVVLRQAIVEAETLDQHAEVRRMLGLLQTELADVLSVRGDYAGARAAYETAALIAEELGDERGTALIVGQLGALAYRQRDLGEAERRCREALTAFQGLREPQTESVYWHQLGLVYARAKQWEPAERAYRAAAALKEERGWITGPNGAADTWHQLAVMIAASGRPAEAEGWYRKALAAKRGVADPGSSAITLNNLANLLTRLPGRLDEARVLAEEALALRRTLDPAAAEIWQTYSILSDIAEQQGDIQTATRYRRAEQAAWAAFPGSQESLRRQGPLIAAVVETATRPEHLADLDEALAAMAERGWGDLVTAIRLILDGVRDPEALCDPLDLEDALIVRTILAGLRDPEAIRDLIDSDTDLDEPEPDTDPRALLARHAPLILAVLAAAAEPMMRERLTTPLRGLTDHGWGHLVAAIERLLAGERDPRTLTAGLDAEDTLIIVTILKGLADPASVAALLTEQQF